MAPGLCARNTCASALAIRARDAAGQAVEMESRDGHGAPQDRMKEVSRVLILGRQPNCKVSGRAAFEEGTDVAKRSMRKCEQGSPQHIFGDGSRKADARSKSKR